MADRLVVRGAREHNLKDVSLDLPRDAMIVFTGLSGSGKSSLAFAGGGHQVPGAGPGGAEPPGRVRRDAA